MFGSLVGPLGAGSDAQLIVEFLEIIHISASPARQIPPTLAAATVHVGSEREVRSLLPKLR
jgi:hypothetical protein